MNYLVTFAKVSIDKVDGIELLGTYFGGLSPDEAEAEQMAHDCVNQSKGGTILPAISILKTPEDLLEMIDVAHTRFEAKTRQMREAHEILTKTTRSGKKSKKTLRKLLD
jgi:hypothetical protein